MSDPSHVRADLALVRRAVRARWDVPDDLRRELPEEMRQIMLGADEPRDRIAAAKVLAVIEGQNQTDDLTTDKNSRIDDGKATERVLLIDDLGA